MKNTLVPYIILPEFLVTIRSWINPTLIDKTKFKTIFISDSQQGHVVMGTQTTSPYQQLIEKTKALSFRSQMLQLNVEKKKKAQDQPNWGTDGF